MTTVEVQESGGAVVHELSAGQAAELSASGVVRVEPGRRAGLWRISGRGLVGAARIAGVEVRIAPKTPVSQLLFMLGYAAAPGRWHPDPVGAAESDGLLPAVSYAFTRAAGRALRRGPLQGYASREETLPTVRGRIRVSEQLRRHFGRTFPVEVRYEEFTEDIPENQLLRSAAEHLLALPGVPDSCRPGLRRILTALPDMTPVEASPPFPQWPLSLDNAPFHNALRLAELILRGASYDLAEAGPVRVDGLLLNMATIFEDFVRAALIEALRPFGGRIPSKRRRWFLDQGGRIRIVPDLIWCRENGAPVAVADAKYKLEQPDGYPNADLYQMSSYCLGLGLSKGHLIYAAGQEPAVRHSVRHADIELVQHALPLHAAPAELLTRVAGIASEMGGKKKTRAQAG
jgi:5-methylcytosine-specific restriction enzyme subunit McrC